MALKGEEALKDEHIKKLKRVSASASWLSTSSGSPRSTALSPENWEIAGFAGAGRRAALGYRSHANIGRNKGRPVA